MFPPMPGGQGQSPAPTQSQGGGMNPSALVETPGASPSQGPTPEQLAEQYMKQVQQLSAAIDALASQFPPASKNLRDAKQALIDSMTAVAGSLAQTNGTQQPKTF